MKSYISFVKVRYAETDQMGVVHHGNYPQYLEIARIEWLTDLGISYSNMEKKGVMLPVFELTLKYHKPLRFNEKLKIITQLRETPNVKIIFDYKIFDEGGNLTTSASTVLVFMDVKTRKPIRCPQYILDKLQD